MENTSGGGKAGSLFGQKVSQRCKSWWRQTRLFTWQWRRACLARRSQLSTVNIWWHWCIFQHRIWEQTENGTFTFVTLNRFDGWFQPQGPLWMGEWRGWGNPKVWMLQVMVQCCQLLLVTVASEAPLKAPPMIKAPPGGKALAPPPSAPPPPKPPPVTKPVAAWCPISGSFLQLFEC